MNDTPNSPSSSSPSEPNPSPYTAPPPSLAPPVDTAPPVSSQTEEAGRIHVNVAKGADDTAVANGPLAPFQTRVIAAVIDSLVGFGLSLTLFFLPGNFSLLVGLAYLVTRDSLPFLGGQSIGKKAMHLKAVTSDGKSLAGNWQPGILRNAVLIIPFFALVELFVLFSREDKPEKGHRLGDDWAKTKVIVVNDATSAS